MTGTERETTISAPSAVREVLADLGQPHRPLSDIELRRQLGSGQLNLGLLEALLRNQQFNDQLGFDMGKFGSEGNRDAIMELLRRLGGG